MRVVIADDQMLIREGIATVLATAGIDVVATVANVPELLIAVARHQPDVALVDVRMPPTFSDEGVAAAEQLRTGPTPTGVLLLSQHVEADYVISLLDQPRPAGSVGVGYLLKDRVLRPETLVTALERVQHGETVVDEQLVTDLLRQRRQHDPVTSLTPRERDVLALVAAGLTNAGIARRLVLSDRTVEVHVRQVFTKLDLPADSDTNRRVLAVLNHLSRL